MGNTIAVYNKVMIEKKKPDILFKINDPYIRSFINICLDFNPLQRPTANELLSHPFLLPRYPRDYILCQKIMNDSLNYKKHLKSTANQSNKNRLSVNNGKNNNQKSNNG